MSLMLASYILEQAVCVGYARSCVSDLITRFDTPLLFITNDPDFIADSAPTLPPSVPHMDPARVVGTKDRICQYSPSACTKLSELFGTILFAIVTMVSRTNTVHPREAAVSMMVCAIWLDFDID